MYLPITAAWAEFLPFDAGLLVSVAVVCFLLLASAFVSGSETAYFSLSPADVESIRRSERSADKSIVRLLGEQDYFLATILIANNLVNICIVVVSDRIIDGIARFHSAGLEFAVKTVVVTFLLLLFGEIIPKVTATYSPLRIARGGAAVLAGLSRVLRPLAYVLVRCGMAVNSPALSHRSNLSMDELSDAIEITSTHSREEKRMLNGIVNFVNVDAEQVMTPRLDVTALEITDDYDTVKNTIVSSGYSRIPVYEETIDNIRGILYVKDLLPHIARANDFEWTKLLRKPYFIPGQTKINDLLEEFQNNKIHMAVVVDEYGSTQGLISLEDIMEEIVGEISDESDTDASFYTRTGENTFIFEAKTSLMDFCKVLELDEETFDDQRGEAETIGGLMLEIRRDFLKKGESVTCHDIELRVESLSGHRMEKIKVTRPAKKA